MDLTISQVAEQLQVSEETVRKDTRSKKLPARKIGKGGRSSSWRITPEALDEYRKKYF